MLKQSIVLSLLSVMFVSCNGAGGGGGQSEVEGMTSTERLALFEQNYLSAAETLEDEAVFRFNPCRDELNWVSTGANSGTIEISGYMFSTDDVVDIQRKGACDVEIIAHNPLSAQGIDMQFESVGPRLTITGDYTSIFLVQGGYLSLKNAGSSTRPSLIQTELVASAEFIVREENDSFPYYEIAKARVDRSDVKFSTSLGLFEVNRSSNSVGISHYNNVAGDIPMVRQEMAGLDKTIHTPMITDMEVESIQTRQWMGNKGPIGMIVFDRILTQDEKKLMSCYGLYLSTKDGDMSLWNKLSSSVCSL